MAGPAFLSNQPQIDLSMEQALFLDTLFASICAPRKIEQVCNFTPNQEDIQGPCGVVERDSVHHLIPGPGGVAATSENGDAANKQLLEEELLDVEVLRLFCRKRTILTGSLNIYSGELLLQYQSFGQSIKQIRTVCAALRIILGLNILGNAITVQHYRWILKSLRDILCQAAPHKVPHRKAYGRILKRLVERLNILTNEQDAESALYSRRLGYVEFLDKLVEDIEKGFVVMKLRGIEDDVFIFKDMELLGYTDCLCSLLSCLMGDE